MRTRGYNHHIHSLALNRSLRFDYLTHFHLCLKGVDAFIYTFVFLLAPASSPRVLSLQAMSCSNALRVAFLSVKTLRGL
jgi:hypothetical protein